MNIESIFNALKTFVDHTAPHGIREQLLNELQIFRRVGEPLFLLPENVQRLRLAAALNEIETQLSHLDNALSGQEQRLTNLDGVVWNELLKDRARADIRREQKRLQEERALLEVKRDAVVNLVVE